MLTRRSLLSALAGLPLIGPLLSPARAPAGESPQAPETPSEPFEVNKNFPDACPSWATGVSGGDWSIRCMRDAAVDGLFDPAGQDYHDWPVRYVLRFRGRLVAMWSEVNCHGGHDPSRYFPAVRPEGGHSAAEVRASLASLASAVDVAWAHAGFYSPPDELLLALQDTAVGRAIRNERLTACGFWRGSASGDMQVGHPDDVRLNRLVAWARS